MFEDIVTVWNSIPGGIRIGYIAAAIAVVMVHRSVRNRLS